MDDLTLLDRLRHWSERKPEQRAVLDHDVYGSRARGELVVRSSRTVAQMWHDVVSLSASFRQLGLSHGDVVAVQLPNWHEWLVTHLALYAIGAVTMPISPVFRTRDVGRQLAVADVRALVVPSSFGSFDYLQMSAELQQESSGLKFIVGVGDVPADSAALSWQRLVEEGSAPEHAQVRGDIAGGRYVHKLDDVMLLNFTSGTTGEPKGVMHSTTTISTVVAAAAKRLELTEKETIFVAVTLGHAGGFLNGIYLPLLLAAPIVYMDLWDAGIALQVIERERITYGPTMPPYLIDLVNHATFEHTDISSWRTARVSGGVMPHEVIARLHRQIPTIRLCPGWGMSELSYVTCGSPHDSMNKLNYTDGRPLEPCQIQIRDETGERELPTGAAGEIVVCTPGRTVGYLGRPQLTAAAATSDGWFRSGDVGFIDQDGYLTVVGRSKDIILRGGENIPVVEIEATISEHPWVIDVAVIGVPDTRLGERVCAVITFARPDEQLTVDQLRQYLVGRGLTRQYIPEYVVPVADLPRTPSGKIRKALVREKFAPRFANLSDPHTAQA